MPKRYKTAKELNDMIDRLEQRVMYENVDNQKVNFRSVTRKDISSEYGDVINRGTGRFRTFEEAQKLQESFGLNYTKEQYQKQLQEFQNSELYNQITIRGARKYIRNKALNTLDYQIEMMEDAGEKASELRRIRRLPLKELLRVIDSAGYRVAEEKKLAREENRNYDSNAFYDYLIQEYQEMVNSED